MQLLPVAAPLDTFHHQIFRGNEGKILPNGFLHDLFIDMEPIGHILAKTQDGIGAEKALRHGDAAVGRIVQRPLQPLGCCSHWCVHGIRHQVTGKGTNALAAHGIALIGHGRGADLILLKGFFHLSVMLQKPNVICHAIAALGNGGKHIQDPAVQLSGIGLTADREASFKSEVCADHPVHFIDLPGIAAKQLHKAGLCSGGTPAAQELHAADDKIQLLQIGQKILHPEGRPLAHGHKLGRLIVGIAQGGHGFIPLSKFCKICNHLQKLSTQVFQTLPIQDDVRIVCDITTGGTQMDDTGS